MSSWRQALRDGVVSGSAASVASTAALALCGRLEDGHAAAPTNATSHWLWGDGAARISRPTLRHTAVGYTIHHAASVFWATLYEKWFGEAPLRGATAATVARNAAVVAALACFVDYRLTPERLRPGFEKRLSRKSLLAVYAAFAAGLAAGSLSRRRGVLLPRGEADDVDQPPLDYAPASRGWPASR